MHFKHFVSIILREYIAISNEKDIHEVNANDFRMFPELLRAENISQANFVREIFDILFRNPPKSQSIADFVGSWIRRPHPIINCIFPDQCKSRAREFGFYKSDFDAYDLKRDKWFNPIGQYSFTPSTQTLSDIDDVNKKLSYIIILYFQR